MKAAFLVKNGSAQSAFEIREVSIDDPATHEVQIKVEAFGLNFADVMARLGMYPDAPKKPGILGYDVVGRVVKKGSAVRKDLSVGQRVLALTRFGGYSEITNTDSQGVVAIGEELDVVSATALATQAGTAYYMAYEMVHIFSGDHVLVHAGAGGVGSILCQMAKSKGAIVYATASTSKKLEYLESIGVDHPINYKKDKFEKTISDIQLSTETNGLDVIFDPIGGSSVKNGFKLLASGGRLVMFGASSLTSAKNIISKVSVAAGFGLYSPIGLLNASKSLIGVNMLRIADDKPEVLQRVLSGAVSLHQKGVIKPQVGGLYKIDQLAEAHEALETRKTMGKIAITWS